MLQIEIQHADGVIKQIQAPDDCVIGKGAQNEIRLDHWRVSKEHARLFKTPSGILLEDMGTFSGVNINGKRVDNQYGPLKDSDVISIGPFKLRVSDHGNAAHEMPTAFSSHPETRHTSSQQVQVMTPLENPTTYQSDHLKQMPAPTQHVFIRTDTDLHPNINPNLHANNMDVAVLISSISTISTSQKLEFEWRKRIHAKLLQTMDLRRHDVHSMSDSQLRHETETLIKQILHEENDDIPAELDRTLLRTQVLNEAIGLGPLEELLADDSVSEIMVNRYDEIYVERAGRLQRHALTFTGDRAVMGVIERIVAPLGRRIDESSPMVDARLKDGSRVNAIIPPLALKGACLTIRKFAKRKLSAQDLVQFGALNTAMATFLEVCVVGRKNIIVSGGTGSGKTTLLNILSNFIPAGERVITVEDAAELKLPHEHLISLESRPANVEGKGAIHIRDLVKNTLRMRPDRIVIGECRGAEALDMLQAMNTGHEGSLTTLHANTPRDGLSRLETMVLMAGMELPLTAIREQIASAVDIIVQQTRFACGTRMVTSITEITGMESGKIQIQELFRFIHQGYTGPNGKVQGVFTGCDMVPGFYEELRMAGNDLNLDIFKQVAAQE